MQHCRGLPPPVHRHVPARTNQREMQMDLHWQPEEPLVLLVKQAAGVPKGWGTLRCYAAGCWQPLLVEEGRRRDCLRDPVDSQQRLRRRTDVILRRYRTGGKER